MSIALSEFWTRLVRAGITDAAGCKNLASAYSKASGSPPSDSRSLAQFLVKSGKLTKFQARSLLAQQPVAIRAGCFLILSDNAPAPLGRWVKVSRDDDGRQGFLLRADEDELAGGRIEWLEAHRQLDAATLQSFELQSEGASILVFTPLESGRVLQEVLADHGSLSPAETCRIGIAVAEALDAMHQRPLLHGAIRPDRVWMTDSGSSILMRDPSGPPPDSAGEHSAGWLDGLASRESYAAPELADPNQPSDPSTDIYGLGCLLFHAVTGRVPYRGDSPNAVLAAHATETPPELAEAIQRGESGDPLFRVIAFAMAKSPAARFSSAQQLAGALRATLPLLSDSDTVVRSAKPPKVELPEEKTPKATKQAMPREKTPTEKKSPPIEPKPRVDKPQPKRAASDVAASDVAASDVAASDVAASDVAASDVRKEKSSEKEKQQPSAPASPPAARPKPPATEAPPKEPASQQPSIAPRPPVADDPPAIDTGPPAIVIDTDGASPEVALAATADSPQDAQTSGEPDDSAEETRPVRRRRKKKNQAPMILGVMCVAILMLIVLYAISDPNEPVAQRRERPPIPDVIPPVTNRTTTTPTPNRNGGEAEVGESVPGYELVSDERLLFVPPFGTDTPSPPLVMLPPGPAIVVSIRMAALQQSELGSQLIDVHSPELEDLISVAEARAKVPAALMSRCSIALHPAQQGWPEVSLAIELAEPQPSTELIEKWQAAASRTSGGQTIYAGDSAESDAYFFVAGDDGAVTSFAVGSVAQISEVAALEGSGIPLPRAAQKLWDASSDQAELVALINPNFLFADGRELLQSTAPELIAPLKSMLQPDVAVASVTAQIDGDRLYVESRFAPSGGISEAALMRGISESFQQWPAWADEFIVESVPDPSWRLLASRLPFMMRFIVDQTRFGISDGAVVTNSYLPAPAVPQVTLTTLLAMNTPAAAGAAVATTTAPERPLSVEEMLDREMTVSFEQESLEFAIDAIVGAFKQSLPSGSTMPPVRIIGGDLQLMGITQNQQVRDFAKTDVPLRTVLTDLVLGANPDKTATGPKDPKQALIWVVADDAEDPPKKEILVTTRQAASGKYELPSEFQIEP